MSAELQEALKRAEGLAAELEVAKSFYNVAVKERDLERFRADNEKMNEIAVRRWLSYDETRYVRVSVDAQGAVLQIWREGREIVVRIPHGESVWSVARKEIANPNLPPRKGDQ